MIVLLVLSACDVQGFVKEQGEAWKGQLSKHCLLLSLPWQDRHSRQFNNAYSLHSFFGVHLSLSIAFSTRNASADPVKAASTGTRLASLYTASTAAESGVSIHPGAVQRNSSMYLPGSTKQLTSSRVSPLQINFRHRRHRPRPLVVARRALGRAPRYRRRASRERRQASPSAAPH